MTSPEPCAGESRGQAPPEAGSSRALAGLSDGAAGSGRWWLPASNTATVRSRIVRPAPGPENGGRPVVHWRPVHHPARGEQPLCADYVVAQGLRDHAAGGVALIAACPDARQVRQGRRPPQRGPAVHLPAHAPRVQSWRAPSTTTPSAVDVVWVARGPFMVFVRSSLSRPIPITPAAWGDFVAAVKRGEYDDTI